MTIKIKFFSIKTMFLIVWLTILPARSHATQMGDIYADPVSSSSASFYWNPSALSELKEKFYTLFQVGMSYYYLTYQRPGISPYTYLPYEKSRSHLPAPDITVSLVWQSPIPWLKVIAGSYSPRGAGVFWNDEHGAQRYALIQGCIVTYALEAGVIITPNKYFSLSATVGPNISVSYLKYAFDYGAYINNIANSYVLPTEDPTYQGILNAFLSDVSVIGTLGAMIRPIPNLKFGASFKFAKTPHLHGDFTLDTPEVVQQYLPDDSQILVTGDIELYHPVPWTISFGTEFTLGKWSTMLSMQYLRKGNESELRGSISNTNPDLIQGLMYMIIGSKNDFIFSGRLGYRFNETIQASTRIDYSPQTIPDEYTHPGNMDFAQFEITWGVLWKIKQSVYLAPYYALMFGYPINVENSIYNLNAPFETGLSKPSANGKYTGFATRIGVMFNISY